MTGLRAHAFSITDARRVLHNAPHRVYAAPPNVALDVTGACARSFSGLPEASLKGRRRVVFKGARKR